MAKFTGTLGYGVTAEVRPGVWEDTIVERPTRGDIQNLSMNVIQGEGVNDGLKLNHRFSITADPYMYDNYTNIRYVVYLGVKWKVSSVQVQRPKLIIQVGEVYHD